MTRSSILKAFVILSFPLFVSTLFANDEQKPQPPVAAPSAAAPGQAQQGLPPMPPAPAGQNPYAGRQVPMQEAMIAMHGTVRTPPSKSKPKSEPEAPSPQTIILSSPYISIPHPNRPSISESFSFAGQSLNAGLKDQIAGLRKIQSQYDTEYKALTNQVENSRKKAKQEGKDSLAKIRSDPMHNSPQNIQTYTDAYEKADEDFKNELASLKKDKEEEMAAIKKKITQLQEKDKEGFSIHSRRKR